MEKNIFIKITLLKLFFLFGIININAQVIYYDTCFANPSDSTLVSKMTNSQLNSFNISATGPNYSWDFSNLNANTQFYKTYINPNLSGYKATWVTNCIMGGGTGIGCNNSWNDTTNLTFFIQDSIILGGVSLYDVAYFYKKNTNVLENNFYAYTLRLNGLNIKKITYYDNSDTIYHFPLQYMNIDSATMEATTDLTSIGIDIISKKHQKRINIVDGWGTLSTPFGYFTSVLRLKTFIYHQDTTISYGTMLPVNTSIDVIYSWFDPNYGVPVLEVKGKVTSTGDEIYSSATYIDSLRCLHPSAHFSYNPVIPIIDAGGNADVNFVNISTNADAFTWHFGDGNSSSLYNPSHTYNGAGTYVVSLIASNFVCVPALYDTINIPVVVLDTNQVVASFTYSPNNTCIGDTTFFHNQSFNATEYYWDFGDGDTSTDENPFHIYNSVDDFSVQLIASDGIEYDTITKIVSIVSSEIEAGNDISISSGDTAFLNATGTGNGFFVWNYDTTLSCLICNNPYAVPTVTTTYYVSKTNACGQGNDSITVFIIPLYTNQFSKNNTVIIYPNPAKSSIIVKIQDNQELKNTKIKIYDLSGKLISNQKIINNLTTINIVGLKKGYYTIHLESKEHSATYKIIKL